MNPKSLKNIGAVDLRFADKQTIENIKRISNAGVVLYSEKQRGLIGTISMSNVGMIEEIGEDYKIEMGDIEIDRNYLESLTNPLKALIVGIVRIHDDVTKELVEDKIAGLYNVGIVESPKDLMGVVKSKVVKNVGMFQEFNPEKETVKGTKEVTQEWLNSLEEETSVDVMGTIKMIKNFNIELFDRKIKSIKVMGLAIFREKYQEIFEKKSAGNVMGSVRVIPDNCELISGNTIFDTVDLMRRNGDKIYSTGTIIFEHDVDVEALRKGISDILGAKVIYSPKHLLDTLILLVDNSIKVITYDGKLLINSGERTITETELKFSEESYHILNKGQMIIDDAISAETLHEKISVIDNYGEIIVGKELFGLIQMKLKINKGTVEDNSKEKELKDDTDVISNMGYLNYKSSSYIQ